MIDLSKVFPEWKAVALLGEGSFGKVYKCEREELGMKLTCAVKVISIPASRSEYESVRKECCSDEEVKSYYNDIVSDFSNEIKLMLMLKGAPNVVSVENFKIVEHENGIGSDIYICMEYLTCFSAYSSANALAEKDVARLGKEICNALAICSAKGIIHRDIKPDNIFIDSYGSFKLGDFGVARRLEGSMSMMSKKGTYSYMAPEVFKGEKYDNRADIYSLGMVMYKLLNRNREPFVDLNKPVVGYNDRNEAIERRRRGERLPAPVDASPAMAAVILKACEFRPEDRFASVEEFRDAINNTENAVVADEPTVAARDFEKTVAARSADLPEAPSVNAGYGDATVVVNNYGSYTATGDETVVVGRMPTVTPPAYTYNPPPVVNNYPQVNKINADNQPQKSKSGKGAIIAIVAVFVVISLIVSGVAIIFSQKEEETTKLKKASRAPTEVSTEDTYVDSGEVTPVKTNTIAAGEYYTVAVKADGTVVATTYTDDPNDEYDDYMGQCDVSGWKNIVAVSAGGEHTVGLKSDGTVVAVGDNAYGKCDVSGWTDIVAIAAGFDHTVGLKSDGTVVADGSNTNGQCDVSGWTDIVAIAAGYYHTVGLKSDGTVVAVGWNYYGQCDVGDWTDIVAIAAGFYHTIGVKSDGTVVAVGLNDDGQCDVSGLKNVVAVSAGYLHTVCLKSDGTVEVVGSDLSYFVGIDSWQNIIAVSAGFFHTVGLKSDGTVVVVGDNDYGQAEANGWRNIKIPQ